MNLPERLLLPDIQSQPDTRNTPIDAVGIRNARYPLTVISGGKPLPTVATLSMTVGLPAGTKSTHMSRFVELLEAQTEPLDQPGFRRMVLDMLERLGAGTGEIELAFPYSASRSAAPLVKSTACSSTVPGRGP